MLSYPQILVLMNHDSEDGFIIKTYTYAVRPSFFCISKIAEFEMNIVSPFSRASDEVLRMSESLR